MSGSLSRKGPPNVGGKVEKKMSLELVRVDVRLIHGQVICGWLPYVKGTCIVVVDDRVSQSKSVQALMRLGLPEEILFQVSSVSDIVSLLNRKEFKPEKILLLFSNLRDLRSAIQAGLDVKMINIGITDHLPQGIDLTKTVSVTPEELEFLEQLANRGVDIDLRMVPMDHPLNFQRILARVKGANP